MISSQLTPMIRKFFIIIFLCSLTGCMYWVRAYKTYVQMSNFDDHFYTVTSDKFTLHFKDPILFSDDFVSLANLYPTENNLSSEGRTWKYFFRKVDLNNQLIKPEINFYSEMNFNKENKITDWSFSSLFLKIAPPQFLEASLRSIGGASIDTEKKQLRANSELLEKIQTDLPQKDDVLMYLGAPLEIIDDSDIEIYSYRFLLDTPHIDKGYENNAINEIKISFDKKTHMLSKMSGNFAGLKVSIDYRDFTNKAK